MVQYRTDLPILSTYTQHGALKDMQQYLKICKVRSLAGVRISWTGPAKDDANILRFLPTKTSIFLLY